MNGDHLYSYSRKYALLKKITSIYHSLYYEDICVKNISNIPENEPVIFTPNHQNALMDALAIIYTAKRQPVFMARADIFKKDTIKKILNFLKIIPVYRIRDGIESLSNNDSSFEQAFLVLKNNGAVGIMPEGNHGEQRRLRPLKKGVARLAIQAQELLKGNKSICIVPVGVDFSTYQGFRGNLLVIYGTPIKVEDFLAEYAENAARGLQSIRNRLTEELKAIMIDIDTDEYYEPIYAAKELYAYHFRENYTDIYEKFLAEKVLTDTLSNLSKTEPSILDTLKYKQDQLTNLSGKLGLENWIYSWKPPQDRATWISDIGRYLIFAPFFAVSAVFHVLPYAISEYYSNKVKDKQFVSSMRFVLSFVAYLVWYLLVLLFPISIYIKVILLISMPVIGAMSFDYWDSLKKAKIKLQFLLLKQKKDKNLILAQKHYNELINWLTVNIEKHAL